MRIRLRYIARLLVAAWIACVPMATVQAQYATLIADAVSFDGGDKVTATGNVEIFYEGQRVLADRLVYDESTDELQVFGPITLIEASGNVLTATFAQLSGDLKEGIMRGARLVLQEQMQIAATEINRVDGRYTQLTKTVASSCRVCGDNPTPLWQIRAERIVHDQLERQLYFDNARFEIAGLPVFWLPHLRMPDPTLRRATGFLVPSLKQTSALGFGFKFPYFIKAGDHADVTVTPFITGNTRTLEGRYRHALRWGNIELNGAVSVDDILPDKVRGYLFGVGKFSLPGDFKLNVNLELVSDRAYLETYDYSSADRLSNGVELTRTRRDEYISASFDLLRTLRDNEVPIEDTLATNLVRGTWERRYPGIAGGEGRLIFDVQGYEREAEAVTPALLNACANVDPQVPASECIARDVFRTTVELGWKRDWVFRNGLLAEFEANLAGDFYLVGQDAVFDNKLTRVTPATGLTFRWPFARTAPNGARDVIEPVVQLAWSETYGDATPNEDSRLVEFDEGNLLALSRFPGHDGRETGARATLGLAWTHYGPTGREYALTVGRILRDSDPDLFQGASGLDGEASDWLVAGRLEFTDRLSLTNRSLFDDSFDFTKSETRVVWRGRKIMAASSYIWVDAAPFEGRTEDVSEWNMDFAYRFDRHWTGKLDYRYDLNAGRAAKAGVGVEYRNECVNIDLSLSRSFTSSTNVEPSTDVGLTVSLNGFGRDGRPYARSCPTING